MTVGTTLEELLAWNRESAHFWNGHFVANPALLELPCGIGGTANVQELLRHVWGVELIWALRTAGLPEVDRNGLPAGPLDALFALHLKADAMFNGLVNEASWNWEETLTLDRPFLAPELRTFSRRKAFVHAMLHSQRHWAQLATLLRVAGFPAGFKGDFLLSQVMK
ncbi:MAG: damage-inducible protein DinB [Terracidiphilus sp.]|jgi:uncharacterized damage-inducible protein DinB